MATLDLDALLHAAGSSLGDAQGQLMAGLDTPPTAMAIAEATVAMKVTVDGATRGALQVATISAADARTGAVNADALSSVTMRFVAFGNDVPSQIAAGSGGAADPPIRSPGTGGIRGPAGPLTRDEATQALQARADIARRVAAGEQIKFEAVQAGNGDDAAWIVTARAATGAPVAVASFAAKI